MRSPDKQKRADFGGQFGRLPELPYLPFLAEPSFVGRFADVFERLFYFVEF